MKATVVRLTVEKKLVEGDGSSCYNCCDPCYLTMLVWVLSINGKEQERIDGIVLCGSCADLIGVDDG